MHIMHILNILKNMDEIMQNACTQSLHKHLYTHLNKYKRLLCTGVVSM